MDLSLQINYGDKHQRKIFKYLKDIKLIYSSIRHPSRNGIVQRINRELGRFFRTFTKENYAGWFEYVNIIQQILNETTHDITEYTPVELFLNIKPTRIWRNYIYKENFENIQDEPHERKIFLARKD